MSGIIFFKSKHASNCKLALQRSNFKLLCFAMSQINNYGDGAKVKSNSRVFCK